MCGTDDDYLHECSITCELCVVISCITVSAFGLCMVNIHLDLDYGIEPQYEH